MPKLKSKGGQLGFQGGTGMLGHGGSLEHLANVVAINYPKTIYGFHAI